MIALFLKNFTDLAKLLHPDNVEKSELASYCLDAVDGVTKNKFKMLNPEFELNHHNEPDIGLFDFSNLSKANQSCRIIERAQIPLVQMIVGDCLIEVCVFMW